MSIVLEKKTYSYEEAFEESKKYFNGNELSASVFLDKYALRNHNSELLESNPDQMHRRIAKEFARIEKEKFKNPLSEDFIYDCIKNFEHIIPQGSPMAGIGNYEQIVSLSNCVHGEAMVYTKEHGLIKMKDVKKGDHVLTHKNRFKKVLNHWSNGFKETITIVRSFTNKRASVKTEQEMSRFLAVTPDHKIYDNCGNWVEAKNFINKQNKKLKEPILEYNEKVPDFLPLNMGRNLEITKELMWIFGIYLAEGSVKNKKTNHSSLYFTLSSEETEYAERLNEYSKENLGHECWTQRWDDYNFIQVNIFDPSFSELIQSIFGSGFKNKRIPDWIFGLNKELKESLIDGFLCGDGTNYESLEDNSYLFSIANPTMAYELGLLARSCGKSSRFNFLCKGKLIKNRTITTSISNTSESKIYCVQSPMNVEVFDMEVEDDHSFVAGDIICHNCFVVPSPEDSYAGICKTDEELAQISKRRGGVGTDVSNLRPEGTPTNNAAKSSTGSIPFCGRFSNTIREVGQKGRRGAEMLTMSIHHPESVIPWDDKDGEPDIIKLQHEDYGTFDISRRYYNPDKLDFATCKYDKTKVTGANISLRVSDDFLQALEDGNTFEQRWPVDSDNPAISKEVSAEAVWDKLIHSAWRTAEPGILFWDNIIRESPADCYSEQGFKTISTNPSLREDTLVLTKKGVFPIKWIAENHPQTEVMNYRKEWHPCDVFKSGENKRLVKITFSNKQSVYCTEEHKWPVLNTLGKIVNNHTGKVIKKKSIDLKNKDKIYFPRINNPFNNKNCLLSREDGFVLGWNQGDGWICTHKANGGVKQYGFIFSEEDVESGISDRVLNYTNSLAKIPSKLRQDHDTKSYSYATTDKSVREKFDKIGSTYKENGVPETVWKGNSEFVKGYIDGIFSSDGYVEYKEKLSNCKIILVSCHKKLIKDIQKLLCFYGIRSNIKYSKDKEKYNRYDLTITGIHSKYFSEFFELSNKRKNEKLIKISKLDETTNNTKSGRKEYLNARNYLVVSKVELTDIYEDVYDITVHDDTHTFVMETGVTGNCGEIPLSAYDSCRLLLLNVFSFVKNPFTKDAYFDYNKFYNYSKIAQRLMDDLVDLEEESILKIIDKIKNDPEDEIIKIRELNLWENVLKACEEGRRTGTGVTAVGDTLAALGIPYGSDEGIFAVEKIYKTLKFGCYAASVEMAEELGPFPIWDREKEKDNPFLNRIRDEEITLNSGSKEDDRCDTVIRGEDLYNRMQEVGRRNIALLTTAPAGSVSILAKRVNHYGTSSGIEPQFDVRPYIRKKKGNPGDQNFRTDSIDQNGDHWMHFEVFPLCIDEWKEISGEKDFEKNPWMGSCAYELNWKKRVSLQAAAQKHVDHSISSCLAAGKSLIQTNKGLFEIEELCEGVFEKKFGKVPSDDIFTVNIENKEAHISESYNNGKAKVFNIKMPRGREISCTENHRLAIIDKNYNIVWKYVRDIKEGDFIVNRKGLNLFPKDIRNKTLEDLNNSKWEYSRKTNSKNIKIPTHLSYDLSRLLGYMCSDGSIRKNGISLCQLENNVCYDYEQILKNIFNIDVRYEVDSRSEKTLYNIISNSREIKYFFEWLGITKHYKIKVPRVIRMSSQKHVKEFIKGCTLDGFVSKNGICVSTSISKKYLEQIQNLLLNMNIVSSVIKSSDIGERLFPNGEKYKTKESWDLFISDSRSIDLFSKKIGFAEERKNEELENKYKRPSRIKLIGEIPDFGLRLDFRNNILPKIKSNKIYNIFHSLTLKDKQGRLIDRESLQEMVDMGLCVKDHLLDDTYFYERIISIEDGGEIQTYDISVPDGNSYICNGVISHNTVNLPEDVSVEQVKEIYETAWREGCKGITVYRDKCRTGVLVPVVDESTKENTNKIIRTNAPKRPDEVPHLLHHATLKGIRYYVSVGLMSGEPYEIFVGMNHDNDGDPIIPKSITEGVVVKEKRGKYVLKASYNGKDVNFNLTNGHSDDNVDALTRVISWGLRHGGGIDFAVHQLEKTKGDMTSFSKVLARTLKKYIKDGTQVHGEVCLQCEGINTLQRQEGCIRCQNCGWTKC